MGMQTYLSISAESIPKLDNILTSADELVWKKGRSKQSGSYEYFEIRVNFVPYAGKDNILLHKVYRKHPGGGRYYTAQIPQRIVTIPDYLNIKTDPPTKVERLNQILLNNVYLSILQDAPDYASIQDAFHYGDLNLYALLDLHGLDIGTEDEDGMVGIGWLYVADANEKVMFSDDHCVDIFIFTRANYARIQSDFIYLPTMVFDQYCESDYPETYADMLGFSEGDYDESSPDFRFNRAGKNQIRTAIRLLRQKKRLTR